MNTDGTFAIPDSAHSTGDISQCAFSPNLDRVPMGFLVAVLYLDLKMNSNRACVEADAQILRTVDM